VRLGSALRCAFVVTGAGLGVAAADSLPVSVERIDGFQFPATWSGAEDHGGIVVETADGRLLLPIDELAVIEFPPARLPTGNPTRVAWPPEPQAVRTDYSAEFLLADGGILQGSLLESPSADLMARTALGERTALPLDRLAGVRMAEASAYPRSEELFREALAARLPGKDVLVTKSVDEPRSLRGRLERLDPNRGSFALSDKTRTLDTDKVYGIVFALGAAPVVAPPVTCELSDGSRISGSLVSGDLRSLKVRTSLGIDGTLPMERLSALRFRSPRVVFLSDLAPVNVLTEGRLHRPSPYRPDANVANGTMRLGGQEYRKGLGVHSRCELVYSLAGEFESFVATIGLDDAVRPRGSVVFRVLGMPRADSEAPSTVLFDSGPQTGADPPQGILVDVRGVERLTLLVDYGAGLDLSDHADWGGARLIRPAASRERPPSDATK
jgi:hypothetical protein